MSTLTVELKLDSIELSGSDKERSIYFVLASTNAVNPQSLAVSHLPDSGNLTLGENQTEYDFAPAGDSGGGLFLLSTQLPANNMLNVRLWVMESHVLLKDIGKILSGIGNFVETDVEKSGLVQAIGGVSPVVLTGITSASDGLSKLGDALAQTGDKQIGFISMDQSFESVSFPLNCTQTMMSGGGKLGWTWLCVANVPTVPAQAATASSI